MNTTVNASSSSSTDATRLYTRPQGPFKDPERVQQIKSRSLRSTFRRAEAYAPPVDASVVLHRPEQGPDTRPRFTETLRRRAGNDDYTPSVFASTPYVGEGPGDTRMLYGRKSFREGEERLDSQSKLAFTTTSRQSMLEDGTAL